VLPITGVLCAQRHPPLRSVRHSPPTEDAISFAMRPQRVRIAPKPSASRRRLDSGRPASPNGTRRCPPRCLSAFAVILAADP